MRTCRELYKYREMIFSLVKRELRGKYKGSILGFLWAFLNPLLQLCVYTIVFTVITRNDMNDFYMYLFVALIPWMYIGFCMTGGSTSVTSQIGMVKKIYFPRLVLPISYATSQFINMLLSFAVIFAVLLITGKGINIYAIPWLAAIWVVEYFMGLGIAILFSCINVYFRDLEQVAPVLSMAWQFLSPVLYMAELIPEKYQAVYMLNPVAPMVVIYRELLYYKQLPDGTLFIVPVCFACVVTISGCALFCKLKRRFAEEL